MKTWDECHEAGMSADQAAEALGFGVAAARKWARTRGVKWRKLTDQEFADRIRVGMGLSRKPVKPRQVNTIGTLRDDSRAMPPEQNRSGGDFWMKNIKTGERLQKRSAQAIYLHAQILGWTEWEWGTVK